MSKTFSSIVNSGENAGIAIGASTNHVDFSGGRSTPPPSAPNDPVPDGVEKKKTFNIVNSGYRAGLGIGADTNYVTIDDDADCDEGGIVTSSHNIPLSFSNDPNLAQTPVYDDKVDSKTFHIVNSGYRAGEGTFADINHIKLSGNPGKSGGDGGGNSSPGDGAASISYYVPGAGPSDGLASASKPVSFASDDSSGISKPAAGGVASASNPGYPEGLSFMQKLKQKGQAMVKNFFSFFFSLAGQAESTSRNDGPRPNFPVPYVANHSSNDPVWIIQETAVLVKGPPKNQLTLRPTQALQSCIVPGSLYPTRDTPSVPDTSFVFENNTMDANLWFNIVVICNVVSSQFNGRKCGFCFYDGKKNLPAAFLGIMMNQPIYAPFTSEIASNEYDQGFYHLEGRGYVWGFLYSAGK